MPPLLILLPLLCLIIYLLLIKKKKSVQKIRNLSNSNFCQPTKIKLPKKTNQCPNCPHLIADCTCCSVKSETQCQKADHSHPNNHSQPNLGQFGATLLTLIIWLVKLRQK